MSKELFDAINHLGKEKGIDKDLLIEALEAALISAYKKNFKSASNVRVDLNEESGAMKVLSRKEIVEEVEDPQQQLSITKAKELDPNYVVGDVVEVEVTPRDFGRIAAQAAKQVVTQRVREAERSVIYGEYIDREEDIMNGIIQRIDPRFVYIDLGKVEAKLPEAEKMPTEEYHVHDRIKVLVTKVENTNKGPQVFVSRSHPGLLKRLFETEVPEIYDGTVEIKSVAREAGDRSKISVYAADSDIDPVGSCVGQKGQRVQTVVDELKGEKIDIVEYSNDPVVYVSNALSPSKVDHVIIHQEEKATTVIVPDNQLSLAIGKRGQNARLAAKLTGWKIDIKSATDAKELGLYEQVDTSTAVEAEPLFDDTDDLFN
ncbi:NusA antitermination factor [Streptohalobacillus salinus]|uniref:Transcription termination/antitermination protein NusA n=1 Tax=Streptohalobacillus salinus TaxID=621096 RepID=A0A2V3WU55_9BACI|nr:transcription termination factor NusA [Streptohalobacillus salinus]PXW92492.1 NusA antitermination factor [Streptohalobacillus salinus]